MRKNNDLTQEELAEKLEVSRQTISKWKLNETIPDVKQTKEISKIFKIIGAIIIAGFLLAIIYLVVFNPNNKVAVSDFTAEVELNCTLNGKSYNYKMTYDENDKILSIGGDSPLSNIIDIEKYEYSYQIKDAVRGYFDNNGGNCNKDW